MASEYEEKLRVEVEARIHELIPDARIIHELQVCGNRADIVAVTDLKIIMFELKSCRDKIDRLQDQMGTFYSFSHMAIAVLDQKFFDTSPYSNGNKRCSAPDVRGEVWASPRNTVSKGTPMEKSYDWTINHNAYTMPCPINLLYLAFAEEQRDMCRKHGLKIGGSEGERVKRLCWNLTGEQITREVCSSLRSRQVLRSKEPIA